MLRPSARSAKDLGPNFGSGDLRSAPGSPDFAASGRCAWRGFVGALASACLSAACSGDIDGRGGPGSGAIGPGGGVAGSGAPGGAIGGAGPGGAIPGQGSAEERPAPTTRAARLTHAQWENSVRDLFHLAGDAAFSSLLRSDPVQSGFAFDNNSLTLEVDEALWSGYQRAAAEVASFVTSDPARLAKIAPPAGGDESARARALASELGLRAHRRPLGEDELGEYLALFAMAPALYDGLTPFQAGARILIEALLQSPHFLYRVEASADEAGGLIALGDYEIASRLSYTLWNTMPDDALFAVAASSTLRDTAEVERQARRMLGDPRAQEVVEHFHAQLFETERFDDVRPSPAFYPDAPAELGTLAATEQALFVRDLVFEQHGSYADLLTSTDTFVNAELARVYGLGGSFGSSFVKAALDPAQRRGILTHVGFLAANASSVNPDPIHRGVFIARRIACMALAAPPADVPPLPEPDGRTNRETVEQHTQRPDTICANCHATIINPLGFPFESFDAIGQLRSEDGGQPVDTRSDALIGSTRVQVANALELAERARGERRRARLLRTTLARVRARPARRARRRRADRPARAGVARAGGFDRDADRDAGHEPLVPVAQQRGVAMSPKVTRRIVLRGIGGAALALPLLESFPFRGARAQAQADGTSFAIFLRQANGVACEQGSPLMDADEPERFWPSSEGALTRREPRRPRARGARDAPRSPARCRQRQHERLQLRRRPRARRAAGPDRARPAGRGRRRRLGGGRRVARPPHRRRAQPRRPRLAVPVRRRGRRLARRAVHLVSRLGPAARRLPEPEGGLRRGRRHRRRHALGRGDNAAGDAPEEHQRPRARADAAPARPSAPREQRPRAADAALRQHPRARDAARLRARPGLAADARRRRGLLQQHRRRRGAGRRRVCTCDIAAMAVACGYTRSVAIQVGNGNDGANRYRDNRATASRRPARSGSARSPRSTCR